MKRTFQPSKLVRARRHRRAQRRRHQALQPDSRQGHRAPLPGALEQRRERRETLASLLKTRPSVPPPHLPKKKTHNVCWLPHNIILSINPKNEERKKEQKEKNKKEEKRRKRKKERIKTKKKEKGGKCSW